MPLRERRAEEKDKYRIAKNELSTSPPSSFAHLRSITLNREHLQSGHSQYFHLHFRCAFGRYVSICTALGVIGISCNGSLRQFVHKRLKEASGESGKRNAYRG